MVRPVLCLADTHLGLAVSVLVPKRLSPKEGLSPGIPGTAVPAVLTKCDFSLLRQVLHMTCHPAMSLPPNAVRGSSQEHHSLNMLYIVTIQKQAV